MSPYSRKDIPRLLKWSARLTASISVLIFLLIGIFLVVLQSTRGGVTVHAESYLIVVVELAGLGGIILTWKSEILAGILLALSSIILAILFLTVLDDVLNNAGFTPWFYLGLPFLIGAVLIIASWLVPSGPPE